MNAIRKKLHNNHKSHYKHNNTSHVLNSSNHTGYNNDSGISNVESDTNIDEFVVVGLGLFVTLLALLAVFSLVKRNQPAPIFVINLLISDVVQLCCMIPLLLTNEDIYLYPYIIGVACSVGFMVCVSMERYLVVAWPLWYRFRRNIKTYVVICVVVWVAPVIIVAFFPWLSDNITSIIMGVFLLLPFPLLIFFLVGTLKALSSAVSVPDAEKRRIVAISVLMLLIYTLLFLPITLTMFIYTGNVVLLSMVPFLASISPLADSIMYILLRKSVSDKVFTSCCKTSNNQQTNNIDDGQTQIPETPVSSSERV